MFRYESFVNGGWPKWTRPYFNSTDEDYNMEMKGCVAPESENGGNVLYGTRFADRRG